MVDIVQKLRAYRPRYGWPEEYSTIVEPTMNHVAADEIERLRKALAKIAQYDMQAIAIDALQPGERIRPPAPGVSND